MRIYFGDEVHYYAHMMDDKTLLEFVKGRYYM